MSLEVASFIKDLVATNPEGTDPKSQGDDHLRTIKNVLKQQFSGLTLGIPITRDEKAFNEMVSGPAKALAESAMNTADLATGFYLVTVAALGVAPINQNGYLLHVDSPTASQAYRVYTVSATGATYLQVQVSGVWGAWRLLLDNVNFNQTVTDANAAIESGFYRLLAPYTNGPTAAEYMLIVVKSGARITQIATLNSTGPVMWQRHFDGSAWGGWVAPVGIAQQLQDVTGSRVIGTPYTNNTGRTIFVCVSGSASTGGSLSITVGALPAFQFCGGAATGGTFLGTCYMPVHNGASYTVTGNGSIGRWYEYR